MDKRKDFGSTLNVVEKIDLLHSEVSRLQELNKEGKIGEEHLSYLIEIYETYIKIEHYQGILDSGILLLELLISLNDLYSASEITNQTFSYLSFVPDVDGFAHLINTMASAFYMDGAYVKSFIELVRLHNFATEYEVEDAIIISAVNRGDILRLIGAHSEAQEQFSHVIKKHENGGEVHKSIYETALLNMCESIIESNENIKRTEIYFEKILELLEGVTDSFGYAYFASVKAKYLALIEATDQAKSLYYECLNIYSNLDENFYMYETVMSFAKLLFKEGSYDECLALLDKYDIDHSEIESSKLRMMAHEIYARTFEAKGELAKAIKHFKVYISYQGDDSDLKESQLTSIKRVMKEDEYRQRVKKLHEENITDQLTNIYNRKKLLADIKKIFVDEKDSHGNYAILMLDLDNFKMINDHNGHVAGDKCLQQVGRVLKDVCDIYNGTSYRYGGDEFFILFTSPFAIDLFEVGEHIRKSIEDLKIHANVDGEDIYVTASVGVLGFESKRETRAREIIKEVDGLMYQAKKASKNATIIKNNII